MRAPVHRKINEYHIAAIVYMICAGGAGIYLSGESSPTLQASGWFIFHAYLAFMGFGTLMILAHQMSLVPVLRKEYEGREIKPATDTGLFILINVSLWVIWLMYLLQGLTGSDSYYYIAIFFGLVILGCLGVFAGRLYGGITLQILLQNQPLRYFATSIFMCFLAYGQMAHVTINEIEPILPFAETLALRMNYLAFSFPISLTIMGGMYTPYHPGLISGEIKGRALWESQYIMLVVGVFSLFFALLFDNPEYHSLFVQMQLWFSVLLVLSIVVLAVAMVNNRIRVKSLPNAVWRYYVCALLYLSAAGVAGLLLGYGWEHEHPMYYFLIQSHVHLALLGWVGFGMPGVFFYIIQRNGGRADVPSGHAQFWLMNAGVVVMCAGIYYKSMAIRGSGGAMIAISFLFLLSIAVSEYRKAA